MDKFVGIIIDFNLTPYHCEKVKKEWSKYGCNVQFFQTANGLIEDLQKRFYCLISFGVNQSLEEISLLISKLRAATTLPILIIVQEDDATSRKQTIELGADEYLSVRSTIEDRVITGAALVRRYTTYSNQSCSCDQSILSYRNLLVIESFRRVFVSQKEVQLTPMEFEILILLMKNSKKLITYNDLLLNVWGKEFNEGDRNLVWHQIKNLRKKLEISSKKPEMIVNIHNLGYRFEP